MECGGCTACCESLPIDEGGFIKKADTECIHCDNGCAVYASRPESGVRLSLVKPMGVIFEKLTTKIYLGLVMNSRIDNWRRRNPALLEYVDRCNSKGISVVISSFYIGLMEVFPAKEHRRDKVIEIALKVAS